MLLSILVLLRHLLGKGRELLHLIYFFFNVVADIPNSDSESFNPVLWEEQRKHRAQVAFECDEDKDERETPPRVSFCIMAHVFVENCNFP